MIRLFKYWVDIYIPKTENQLNWTAKGLVQVTNWEWSKKKIEDEIIKKIFLNNKEIMKITIKQIPII